MKMKSLLLCFCLMFTVAACSSKSKKTGTEGDANSTSKMDNGNNAGISLELNGDSDSNKAGALRTVYFDFNSASIAGDTKETLVNNAKFLKANTSVKVQVEGHADERGGVQFNLALGEKRAKTVKDFLVTEGVEASRISTISFGKEKPVAFGHDEDAWSKNRRANFVIIAK